MPIITVEQAPERRRRSGRGLWLLLVPPGVALALLVAAASHPLQLGHYMLFTVVDREPGISWTPVYNRLDAPRNPTLPVDFFGHPYIVTGDAHLLGLGLGDWACAVICFRGHPQRH